MALRSNAFETIRSEGGLLPVDLLKRVLDQKEKLVGTLPENYGLPHGERLTEVITPAWNRLRKHWAEFRSAAASLSQTDAATGLTNDKWSLPLLRELGFGLLPTSAGPEIGGRTYAINRFFGLVPVHLVGCGLSLDRRAAGVRGAAATNPHGLVQDFLNRSPRHLWGILSNGSRLRILRDNQALSRQSFVEFDLEAMFAGEVYSDFVLLWLVAHATRFAPLDSENSESCWLEQWMKEASRLGTRVLGDLRIGVERALQILGEGYTSYPGNVVLRDYLRTGQISLSTFHSQLLRVVYRLIFLFVAEDRTIEGQSLLHPRDDSETGHVARERYLTHYSTTRFRDLASRIKGTRHTDLWHQFQIVVQALAGETAFKVTREQLALPALGSFLWAPSSTGALNNLELTNYDLLEALRHLAFTRAGSVLQPVDFRNLGAEELGGLYESLLALTPQISADGARFTFAEFAGNERKTSGSYYTPDALVQRLLDSALDPVIEKAIAGKTAEGAESAILGLKICDPAVGSGHFLVGAAHRLARHLSRARALAQGESEPSPLFYQRALRDVIGRCLYGVDLNPMAAELCRVSLWLEALEPGKPLSFLDHHIRVGDSLVGTTPNLILGGIPDEAFSGLVGDDPRACKELRRRNRAERQAVGPLFAEEDHEKQLRLAQAAAVLEQLPDDRPEDIIAKESAFREHEQTEVYRLRKQIADTWCASFAIQKRLTDPSRERSAHGITQGRLDDLTSGRTLPADLQAEVASLSDEYRFFHWHLAFPEVFSIGGFDCVLGNPPWEHTELKEREWFAERSPEIAAASTGAERKKMIDRLSDIDQVLYASFIKALRKHEASSHFLGSSGRYPLCGRGRINTYAVFAENMRNLLTGSGRAGVVLPTGIATDDTTKLFFEDVVFTKTLVSLLSFENEEFIFPAIHHSVKFCLFTCGGAALKVDTFDFVFFARNIDDLSDAERCFTLTAADIALINPNTHTCPVFRSRHDVELLTRMYKRVPVFLNKGDERGNPWGISFRQGLFNMTSASGLFRTVLGKNQLSDPVPLYESKMIQIYDHRDGSYESRGTERGFRVLPATSLECHKDPGYSVKPFYWVEKEEVSRRLPDGYSRSWLFGFRDITSATSERTFVCSFLPLCGVGNNLPILIPGEAIPASLCLCLAANLSSLCLDFAARQKVGGVHVNFFYVEQFPVCPPEAFSEKAILFIVPRVLELVYTAFDVRAVYDDAVAEAPSFDSRSLDDPLRGLPFEWDEDRRALLRAELDAYFAVLYGFGREDLRYLLDPVDVLGPGYPSETFRVLKEREVREIGEYRTRRLILEAWDRLRLDEVVKNTSISTK